MASRGKRARTAGESGSQATPTIISRHLWPKREGQQIAPQVYWESTPREEVPKHACTHREISDEWDEYDTLFYNAWIDVEIRPTRFIDNAAIRRMKIQGDVQLALENIGLGTLCTKHYELYPDLVRQFMATVQVYYSGTYPKAQEGTLTFFIRGVRYRISIPELCTIFGFATHPTGITLDGNVTTDIQTYWSRFAEGRYSSRGSMQTDIRHPVLRILCQI
ncbi:hypothetical protein V5N11_010338 [Cardamine amara subsp. amara]|uniref:Arabidopsis retrotransposon Orf1 C-terminal domain-containing protein n=1 Tax=Cardamine amara subsp. amara TaxID=228776 RepID=A0ABD0ZID5_CARAN